MADLIAVSETLTIATQGHDQIIDITEQLNGFVAASGADQGQVTVFVPGATASVSTIEMEPGLERDLPQLLEELIPFKRAWAHNQTWGDGNGGSHLRAALIGPSLTIPIIQGQLTLGTWQQVILIDHDIRARQRQVVLQIIGQ